MKRLQQLLACVICAGVATPNVNAGWREWAKMPSCPACVKAACTAVGSGLAKVGTGAAQYAVTGCNGVYTFGKDTVIPSMKEHPVRYAVISAGALAVVAAAITVAKKADKQKKLAEQSEAQGSTQDAKGLVIAQRTSYAKGVALGVAGALAVGAGLADAQWGIVEKGMTKAKALSSDLGSKVGGSFSGLSDWLKTKLHGSKEAPADDQSNTALPGEDEFEVLVGERGTNQWKAIRKSLLEHDRNLTAQTALTLLRGSTKVHGIGEVREKAAITALEQFIAKQKKS